MTKRHSAPPCWATIVTSASNPSLNRNGGFGIAIGGVAFSGPTDWRIAKQTIRWIGYTNGTWLPDTDRSTLGFIAPDVVQGFQGGTRRAFVGPCVTGLLVSAASNF